MINPAILRKPATLAACFLAMLCGEAIGQNVEFSQTSDPVSIVNVTTFPLPGATVSTVTAPDVSGSFHFAYWTVNDGRALDPSGSAVNPASFVVAGATQAVAHYLPTADDLDLDDLPDWWEQRYFGNLVQTSAGDFDGDGYSNLMEYESGSNPRLANVLAQGGISRRRAIPFNVEVGVGDPTWPYGGISRRRTPNVLVVQNTAAFATLRESSSPAGVFAQTRVVVKGTTVNLTNPPLGAGNYRFTGWLVNDARIDSATQLQPIPITVTADTQAVARYIPVEDDTDGDTIPDWLEWFLFDSLQYDRTSDPDGDGLTFAVEEHRGYSQVAADDLAMGGVSRRRSLIFTVDTTGRFIYRLVSDPATILNQTQYLTPGTMVTVPDEKGHSVGNYLFAWWDLDGQRKDDRSGVALNQFSFAIDHDATATAHYFDPTVDSDQDGILDWNEITYYGTLERSLSDDTDHDGFDYAAELFRSYSPRVVDTLAAGGVSRRRSVLTPINAVFLPNPPALGANAATNIASNSAILSATINPIGSETTAFFRFSFTADYTDQTPAQALGNGLQALTIATQLLGLEPGTVYHFQVVATNGEGTSISEDSTFATLPLSYDVWSAQLGIGAPAGDDDEDGIPNLVEFAFGLNPLDGADVGAIPDVEVMGGRLRLHCSAPGISGVLYGAEYSDDLLNWTPMVDLGVLPNHEFLTPAELVGVPGLFVRWVIQIAP